jgi:hypothetical protein
MSPQRIQMSRRKGWCVPLGAIVVSRPSRWGNPFVVGRNYMWLGETDVPYPVRADRPEGEYDNGITVVCCSLENALIWHAAWVADQDLSELTGRDLACWCPLSAPCHGDNLLAAANIGANHVRW